MVVEIKKKPEQIHSLDKTDSRISQKSLQSSCFGMGNEKQTTTMKFNEIKKRRKKRESLLTFTRAWPIRTQRAQSQVNLQSSRFNSG